MTSTDDFLLCFFVCSMTRQTSLFKYYNVTVNSSASISTATYDPFIGQGMFLKLGTKYHCWEIVVPVGKRIKAVCEINTPEMGFDIALLDDHFQFPSERFSRNTFPDNIISKSNILDILIRSPSGNQEENTMECNLTSVEEDTCLPTNINIVEPVPLNFNTPDWRKYDCVWFFTSPNYTFISIDIVHASIGQLSRLSFGRLVGLHNNVTSYVDSVNFTTSMPNGTTFYSTEGNIRMSLSSEKYETRASSLSLVLRSDEDVCGQRNISIIELVPFTIYVDDLRIVKCLWFFTSPNYTFIYLDITHVSIKPKQTFSFGQVFGFFSNETNLEDGVSLSRSPANGTSFYFSGNRIWLSFSQATYINDAPPWNVILRYEDHEGRCRTEQGLCEPENKCLPPSTFCDGYLDCPNYNDEIDCNDCGTTNNHLQFGDSITILGESPSSIDSIIVPYFAVYSGTSESIQNITNVSLVEYPNTYGIKINCFWRFTEPPGSRIKIEILDFYVYNFELRIGSGADPSYGEPMAQLNDQSLLPLEVFADAPSVWITVRRYGTWSAIYKFRLIATVYDITECSEEDFPCPSGLHCVNTSSLCDGKKHCAAHEDELGCAECDCHHYACASGDCIPRYQRCNGLFNCDDMTDELYCGLCANYTIETTIDAPYSFIQQVDRGLECIWLITSDLGFRVQLEFIEIPFCEIAIGEGELSSGNISRVISVNYYRFWTFPPIISLNGPSIWIRKTECRQDSSFSPARKDDNTARINIRQYIIIDCGEGEFSCTSGPRCINESAVCDGWRDCPEKEDEFGCGDCSKDQFSCRTGTSCISNSNLCDGNNDCPDLSDEFDCGLCHDGLVKLNSNDSKLILTPLWPLNYPSNSQCQWVLVAEVGYRVVVTFLEFNLEQGYDFLHIGNGNKFWDPYITLSGFKFPLTTASIQNELFLLFTSDEIFEEKGFKLDISQAQEVNCGENEVPCQSSKLVCVQNDNSERGRPVCFRQDECGPSNIYLHDGSRDLKSPGYPSTYPPSVACRWRVYPNRDAKRVLIIDVLTFLTEIERDVLHIESYGQENKTFKLDGATKVRSIFLNSTDEVHLSFFADSTVERLGFHLRLRTAGNSSCENGTFDCLNDSCVLNSAKCDGIKDCQRTEVDEEDCKNIECPGFYRCQNTTECKYRSVICNGHNDCQLGDDEEDCDQQCPDECNCEYDKKKELVVNCDGGWDEDNIVKIVKITKRLTLSGANISELKPGLFKDFLHLNALSLSGNAIHRVLPGAFVGLTNLVYLEISNNSINNFEDMAFMELRNLQTMLAINISLEYLQAGAFNGLRSLRTLALIRTESSDEPVEVGTGAVTDLVSLEKLYVDDYRLCCEFETNLPSFTAYQCQTTELQPPLNLCGSLMQNNLLRVSMWVLGLSALIGNAVVIIKRQIDTDRTKSGNHSKKIIHSIMVLNLAVSDFMMGVYMLIIAGADLHYGNNYSQEAKQWRSTELCKIAGVLSVMSSEASVFIVTLISVNCFLSIVYPFSSRKLSRKSTNVLMLLVWLVSLGLSIGPTIFGSGINSDIYGLSDVCIGLPLITKPTDIEIKEGAIDTSVGNQTLSIPVATGKKPAWIFSIILFLGVNLACFIVVLFCYIAIFVKVKRTANKVRMAAHRDREIKLAVKMALIVCTDFACWMPVIIMGILSQSGAVVISPEIYAWTVVFILPINSSLNPYLYTLFTSISERRTNNKNSAVLSGTKKSIDTLSLSVLNKNEKKRQMTSRKL